MTYLKYDNTYWAIDIETESLSPSLIWCMGYENIGTGESGILTDYSDIRKFFEDRTGHFFVGHNLLKFDAPVLNRIIGLRIGISRLIDTLVLSTLYNPSLEGGHSLDEWGKRIKMFKGEFNDWSHLSEEMIVYCRQDVKVTAELYRKLAKVLTKIGFSERSCYIQHHITMILERQHKNGFEFDAERAMLLYQELRQKEEALMEDVRKVFPPERRYIATRNMYKKDGSETKIYQQDKERYIIQPGNMPDTYMAFEDVEFNLGSPAQRTQRLLDLGWVNHPDEVTKGGNPKPFDKNDLVPSLRQFLEDNPIPEVELIVRWMWINGRANMINNWLEHWNEDDGRIHGKLFVADTLRFRHQAPNTANIPAVRVDKSGRVLFGEAGYYTYESRDLWCARPGRVLVGTDAAGLELRMLAHYLNRPEFTDGVVNGDPHQSNADLAGVTRPQAKTLIYACVPMDTQALTRQGWKTYDQLEVGELILTYNAETKHQEWQPLLEKIKIADQPVIELQHGQGFSVRSTPDHRWFVSRRTGHKIHYRVDEVRQTQEITEDCNIIVNAPLDEPNETCGYDWTRLSKYSTDWVDVVLNMSQQERRAFLSGFMIADGYEDKGNWRWSQLDGPLYEAALLCSYLVNDGCLNVSDIKTSKNPMKCVLLNKKPHVTGQKLERIEHPRQDVWCVRTKNGSWVMRQGDVITITGNCLYGAQGPKIAKTLGISVPEGKAIRQQFLDKLGIGDVMQEAMNEQKVGRVWLVDGSGVICPSPHAALNYKLQGGGARVMALGSIFLERHIRRQGLDSLKVGDIHDEWQYDVDPKDAAEHARLSVQAIREAGEELNLNVPLDGTAKEGLTWAQTH